MTNTPRKPTTVRHTRASILSRTSKAGTRPQHSILDQQTTEKKRRSLITTREALKQRPAWDMRGKISDLETQLEKNQHQLEGLHKFKNELTLLNQEKDSELKQALERVVAIKTELQMVGKTHAQEMEDQQARQRIHYQELKDQHLIYKRQEGTMEIMVEDARRKLKQAQSRMDQVTQERQQWQIKSSQVTTETQRLEQELHHVEMKLKRFDGNLADRERTILQLQAQLEKEQPTLEAAELKLQKAVATNRRLKTMVDKELHKVA